MNAVIDALMLDLVEWLSRQPRSYAEAIEAWRTSCPRLTVWEDAMEQGLITCITKAGGILRVVATPLGIERLAARASHGNDTPRAMV
jgi:hypothetical protein